MLVDAYAAFPLFVHQADPHHRETVAASRFAFEKKMKSTNLRFRFNMTMPQCNVNIVCKKNPSNEHTYESLYFCVWYAFGLCDECENTWTLKSFNRIFGHFWKETKDFRVTFFKMNDPFINVIINSLSFRSIISREYETLKSAGVYTKTAG